MTDVRDNSERPEAAIIGACGACKSLLYHGDRTCPRCGAPAGESPEVAAMLAYTAQPMMFCSSDALGTMCSTSDGVPFMWGDIVYR